jgi:hypothetical protein
MLKKTLLLAVLWSAVRPAEADEKLAFIIPRLFSADGGLYVETDLAVTGGIPHQAHFASSFQSVFARSFNDALGTQLAAVPLPSPASGFTYEFNPAVGVFTRSTESFGPILADRAETIGKRKLTLGFNYQFFTFDTVEGLDLAELPAVFTHDPRPGNPPLTRDQVATLNDIDLKVGQFTAFLTYGLTDRLDLSLIIPVVSVEMTVASDARIHRLAGNDSSVHYFSDSPDLSSRRFEQSGSAAGLGDVHLRLKATAGKWAGTGFAGGVDVRLPTGDEEDFLGTGALGLRPFLALSFSRSRVSPHFNFAYQWNGDSILAGDVVNGVEGNLSDQIQYVVGTEIRAGDRLTIAVDLLGSRFLDASRVLEVEGRGPNGEPLRNIGFQEQSFSVNNAAIGFKLNAGGSLLIDVNVILKLDDGGMRDKLTPLFGIEYSF